MKGGGILLCLNSSSCLSLDENKKFFAHFNEHMVLKFEKLAVKSMKGDPLWSA